MATIILVSCGASKNTNPSPARELYTGALFRNSLAYAEKLGGDKIFILSALHGLVELDTLIAPYNVTLSPVSKKVKKKHPDLRVLDANEKKAWALTVTAQLANVANLGEDVFIFLAGESYIKPLRKHIVHLEEPLKGLRFAFRVQHIKQLILVQED